MTNAQAVKCAWIAHLIGASTSGFTADSNHPNVTASNVWYWYWRYISNGELPPGTRVYCGLALPDYIANLYMAQDAASTMSVTYLTTDASEQVLDKIIAAYPYDDGSGN